MRSVMRKPLTMLVTAAVMAMKPSTLLNMVAPWALVTMIAPTTEMAEMALVMDISGVWSSGETLRMTSRPTKVASMKTYKPSSRLEGMGRVLLGGLRRGQAHAFADARVDHLTGVRHQSFANDFVFEVERELAVLDQVLQESCDVPGVHLAGVVRNGGGQVERAEDLDAAFLNHFSGASEFAVTATFGGDIDNQRTRGHVGGHLAGDEHGGLLAGHGGSGDDHVLLGQDVGQGLALAAVEIFAHGLGVAAFVFRSGVHDVQNHEARSQAFDLLLDGGADIIPADHSSQAASGSDGLETSDARADHQHARWGYRAGGRHEHGEHAGEVIGGHQRGL